jgi:hypothetical protein
MIRGRKPAGGGGHNPSSRGAVYDQRTYGSVGAGVGNCPGYPTDRRVRASRAGVIERRTSCQSLAKRTIHRAGNLLA